MLQTSPSELHCCSSRCEDEYVDRNWSEALRALTDQIIGAFYDVYNELGYGFLESVYEDALAIALQELGLRVERQVTITVWFRGQDVGDSLG
jgi:hypothetical protein